MARPSTTERPEPPKHSLTGSYRIRVVRPVLKEATRLCPSVGDYFDLRAQALKLRYWPVHQVIHPGGYVLDLNWEWIKALPGMNVGELRIEDMIGGHDNLRVVFYVGDSAIKRPLPMIWILAVLQKKRQGFTNANIENFRGRRALVEERFYRLGEFE